MSEILTSVNYILLCHFVLKSDRQSEYFCQERQTFLTMQMKSNMDEWSISRYEE